MVRTTAAPRDDPLPYRLLHLSNTQSKLPSDISSQLHSLYETISSIPQSEHPSSMFSPLAQELSLTVLFQSKEASARLYHALCIAQVLRLTAPEAPFSDKQLCTILELFHQQTKPLACVTVNGMTASTLSTQRYALLEQIVSMRMMALFLDIPAALTRLWSFVETGLACKTQNASLERLWRDFVLQFIEESHQLENKIMVKCIKSLEFPVTRQVLVAAAERLSMALGQLFAEENEPGDKKEENDDDSDDDKEQQQPLVTLSVLRTLSEWAPSLLLHLTPLLESQLLSDQDNTRLTALNTVTSLLKSHSSFHSLYPSLFTAWQGRSRDKSQTVRSVWIHDAFQLLLQCPSILPFLLERALDPDEKMRVLFCDAMKESLTQWESMREWHRFPGLLEALKRSTRDKKPTVRLAAMQTLAMLFDKYFKETVAAMSPLHENQALELWTRYPHYESMIQLPNALLHAAFSTDKLVTMPFFLEMDSFLLGMKASPNSSLSLLRLFAVLSCLDSKSQSVFQLFLLMKNTTRFWLNRILLLSRADENETESMQELLNSMKQLSNLLSGGNEEKWLLPMTEWIERMRNDQHEYDTMRAMLESNNVTDESTVWLRFVSVVSWQQCRLLVDRLSWLIPVLSNAFPDLLSQSTWQWKERKELKAAQQFHFKTKQTLSARQIELLYDWIQSMTLTEKEMKYAIQLLINEKSALQKSRIPLAKMIEVHYIGVLIILKYRLDWIDEYRQDLLKWWQKEEKPTELMIRFIPILSVLFQDSNSLFSEYLSHSCQQVRLSIATAKWVLFYCPFSLDAWLQCALLMQHPIYSVRECWSNKLFHWLMKMKDVNSYVPSISCPFSSILFYCLCAHEPDQELNVRQKENFQLLSNQWDCVALFPILIYLLAHHPDTALDQAQHAFACLQLYIETVCVNGDLARELYAMSGQIKRYFDVLDSSSSKWLYVCAEIAMKCLQQKCHSQHWPLTAHLRELPEFDKILFQWLPLEQQSLNVRSIYLIEKGPIKEEKEKKHVSPKKQVKRRPEKALVSPKRQLPARQAKLGLSLKDDEDDEEEEDEIMESDVSMD